MLATAQGRLAAEGTWALNEKAIVERAGLGPAQRLLDSVDLEEVVRDLGELLGLPPWR